jgi:hypothetical protein
MEFTDVREVKTNSGYRVGHIVSKPDGLRLEVGLLELTGQDLKDIVNEMERLEDMTAKPEEKGE